MTTTNFTTSLGIALPTTGDLSGTWGDTVNDYISKYLDAAVAGALTVSTDVTLTKTTNSALGATSSQYAILIASGHAANITVTAPAISKVYLVINKSGSYTVKIRGAGPTTGITVPVSTAALVAWDGSDFVLISSTDVNSLSNVLTAVKGGTGQSSYTVGDLLYASSTTALSKLADVATGNALISGGVGVAPSYGKIGLTTHVSGTLPVANGGTGAASLTANNVLLGNGTSAFQVVAPGTSGNVLVSNGTTWTTQLPLEVSSGGTGETSLAANSIILGNGTSPVLFVAPGTSGNILVSDGTTWQSQASSAFLFGQTNSTSPRETSLGYQAGNVNTGVDNVFIGYQAGVLNSTGTQNVAIGASCYTAANTGNRNIAIGYASMSAVTNGEDNVAIGSGTMLSMSTGYSNTGVGSGSLAAATGNDSTAVGYYALNKVTSGLGNTAIGSSAGARVTTGGANVLIGSTAGSFVNSGNGNIVIGDQAASTGVNNLTSGASNTLIGTNVVPSSATVGFELTIGSGLTGKGTQTAFIGGTNGAYNAKNVTTWETTSDRRIKKNIVPFNQGLEVLNQIQVKNFEYRAKEEITELDPSVAVERSGVQIGIIAQELQQVLPQCVTQNSTGVLSVNTDSLVWYLINAVKQLSAEVEQLKQG